jgi:hypothetical protein
MKRRMVTRMMKVLEPPLRQVDTAVIPGVRGTIDR